MNLRRISLSLLGLVALAGVMTSTASARVFVSVGVGYGGYCGPYYSGYYRPYCGPRYYGHYYYGPPAVVYAPAPPPTVVYYSSSVPVAPYAAETSSKKAVTDDSSSDTTKKTDKDNSDSKIDVDSLPYGYLNSQSQVVSPYSGTKLDIPDVKSGQIVYDPTNGKPFRVH